MFNKTLSDASYQVDALDGVRGFAALLVVLSHMSNSKFYLFPGFNLSGVGKPGVYLFFILSAFLLSRPLIHQWDRIFTVTTMTKYWQRRFLRIYPLYIVYLTIGLLSSFFFTYVVGRDFHGIPFYLDVSNFVAQLMLREGVSVTWSIVVEFKFYILLPFAALFLGLAYSKSKILALVLSVFFIVSPQIFWPQASSMANSIYLVDYLSVFSFGMFIVLLQDYTSSRLRSGNLYRKFLCFLSVISSIVFLLLFPSIWGWVFDIEVPGNYFHKQMILFSILFSIVVLAILNDVYWLVRFFSFGLLRFLGLISFSLYMLHPIFIKAFKNFGFDAIFSAWMILFASILVSYFSYRLIEKPCSRILIYK